MNQRDYPEATGRPDFEPTPLDDGAGVPAAPVVPGPADDAPGTAVEPARETKPAPEPVKKGGAASSTWAALIIGALLLILLLVFIMQNQQSVELNLFAWTWNFPLGVGLLLASIIGALIMACAGAWKMFEMKRRLKRR